MIMYVLTIDWLVLFKFHHVHTTGASHITVSMYVSVSESQSVCERLGSGSEASFPLHFVTFCVYIHPRIV